MLRTAVRTKEVTSFWRHRYICSCEIERMENQSGLLRGGVYSAAVCGLSLDEKEKERYIKHTDRISKKEKQTWIFRLCLYAELNIKLVQGGHTCTTAVLYCCIVLLYRQYTTRTSAADNIHECVWL